MLKRLRVWHRDIEITDSLQLINGKATPFGWSQYEIHYHGQMIGWLESGYPMDFSDGYSYSVEDYKETP